MFMRIRSGAASARLRRGGVAALAASVLTITSCSTNNVLSLRPDVDLGMETAAVSMAPNPAMAVEAADPFPDQDFAPAYEESFSDVPEPAAPAAVPADPILAGISTPGEPTFAADPQFAPAPTVVPEDPILAGFSTPNDPAPAIVQPEPEQFSPPPVSRSIAPPAPGPLRMPADEYACRQQLKRLDVAYEDIKPINDGGACRIDYPIKLKSIGSVRMQPAATLRCEMALAVATWTKKELVPSSRSRYFSGVKAIHQASSYSCRKIARSRTMSEHSKGNALDISRIELNNGKSVVVEKPGLFAFRTKGLLNNVRSDACEYFSTVLGPGYNHDHRDHFHFDIKPRRRTACH
jgi:hypothetical protein